MAPSRAIAPRIAPERAGAEPVRKRSEMSDVDLAVLLFAAEWLEDHPELNTPQNTENLATVIQRAAEDWLEEHGANR